MFINYKVPIFPLILYVVYKLLVHFYVLIIQVIVILWRKIKPVIFYEQEIFANFFYILNIH